MKPKSDNLFHFTKSLEVLKLILKGGIAPRFCLEDVEWFDFADQKHIAFPMSCFCDIPLSRISEHTSFYGDFGIGLTKSWGLINGLSPVAYTTHGGAIQNLMKFMFALEVTDESKKLEKNENAYKLWSLIKPITGKMIVAGGIVEKEFYQENEWRYCPPCQDLVLFETFEQEREEANRTVEKYTLEISPSDIRYIFVKSDNDIPELSDFISTELGHFSLNDLKILQSRIVSLDTLNRDL
jgi:hypothetical protein